MSPRVSSVSGACREAGVVLALGYQRRKEAHFRWIRRRIDSGEFGRLVNAEANISRDRLGKIDLASWRYTAEGMRVVGSNAAVFVTIAGPADYAARVSEKCLERNSLYPCVAPL